MQLPLPAAWNGRFFMQGGGGTEGSVPPATGSNSGSAGANFGITNGYAVASQDGGHENSQLYCTCVDNGNTNEFFLDPMGTIDFAYQSIEVTTLTAKYLIAAILRRRSGSLLLGRLLDRRPPGDGDVAEFPAIFQRHRRRRSSL